MFSLNQSKQQEHRINLRLLIWLRMFAIAGQCTAVYLAQNHLGLSLQSNALYTWIGIYTFINFLTYMRLYSVYVIHKWEFFTHLLVDIFILTILFKFSEGGANPFVSLYLIPLTISAITLPALFTWALAAIAISCYSLLIWIINPIDSASFHAHNFEIHAIGMWLGFVISAILVAFFVVRMGRTIQLQQKELAEQKTQALQNEQLIKLGALAASTAHELGTPLGTMQLVVEELQDEPKLSTSNRQLIVLKNQITRCKEALSILSASVGSAPLESGEPMTIQQFTNELLEDWQQSRPEINIKSNWQGDSPGPQILAEKSLQQAIKNILDNAANVSPDYVFCEAQLAQQELVLKISDHGPGIALDEQHKFGHQPISENSTGLGLGLFLSHGIIKRFGGNVSLTNLKQGGLQTTVSLPLNTLLV